MKREPGESYVQFRKRVMDPISPSFCAAKWLDATIWLNSGKTSSCHHTPAHNIDTKSVGVNPMAIHNTSQKKEAREQMLAGKKPTECSYCWKMEELNNDHTTDRIMKTLQYDQEDVEWISNSEEHDNAYLRTLEIAFDRSCNFACMYCSPSYSTTWVSDIKKQGAYTQLFTDKLGHYSSDHSSAGLDEHLSGVFTNAFWQAWPQLSEKLIKLRVTGGEPLISPHFWRLLDHLDENLHSALVLAVNTNLGVKQSSLQKLLQKTTHVKGLEVYTSCEAYGEQAEYIRDGLRWSEWVGNVEFLMSEGTLRKFVISGTVNVLSVFSICQFLEKVMEFRLKYEKTPEKKKMTYFSLNLLRNPHFQSVAILPQEIRCQVAENLKIFLNEYQNILSEFEKDSVIRLANYLKDMSEHPESSFTSKELAKDLKRFLEQYDQRRNKNYQIVFPSAMVEWMNSL